MNGGVLSFSGDASNLSLSALDDLNFLMGSLANGNQWFPTDELKPYTDDSPRFCLLDLSFTAFISLDAQVKSSISSISVTVGIIQLPLLGEKLYMDPLGVMITLSDTSVGMLPTCTWGLKGAIKLCDYTNQGIGGLDSPDFEFDYAMSFPNLPLYPDFSISGDLENPSDSSVNKMLQDLISPDLDVGLADELTVNSFTFDTTANTTDGTISSLIFIPPLICPEVLDY